MPRPKRKKIEFTEEGLNDLMQEIYNDSHNIKSKISRLFIKWEAKVKEGGEIAAIGGEIVKLISAEAKNQDQKIMLLKYLKEIVYRNDKVGNNDSSDNNNKDLTDDNKDHLMELVEDALKHKGNN